MKRSIRIENSVFLLALPVVFGIASAADTAVSEMFLNTFVALAAAPLVTKALQFIEADDVSR